MPVYMPSASDVHVNKMLTEVLVGYENLEYIADQIFPVVTVSKQTDIIPEVEQSAFFRNQGDIPLGEADIPAAIGYSVDTSSTYRCNKHALRHFISDDRRANEDAPFDSDRDATFLVTNALSLQRERAWVSDFWKTSVWTTDKVGGTDFDKFSDYGSSEPVEVMREYKRTIRRMIGRNPNTLVLGDLTRDVLIDHPDVLERIKYTERGIATTDLLAALFDMDRVLVGESIYTADAEGTAEASVSYTASWDDDALMLYAPSRPSIFTPSAGYTFVWNTGMGNGIQYMRKYRDDVRGGDWVEVRSYYDQKSIVENAGLFLSDCVDAVA